MNNIAEAGDKMPRIAICDDQEADRRLLQQHIQNYPTSGASGAVLHFFSDGETLLDYYREGNSPFDILFLDIYMTGINGIDVAKRLRSFDPHCILVFTTSSSDHALKSFEVFPLNYLIKPLSYEAFCPVYEKALQLVHYESQQSLVIKNGALVQTILYRDLLYIESNGKTLSFHTLQKQKITCNSKLDELAGDLEDQRFVRCHKSFLVNMDYVKTVESNFFHLVSRDRIPITQRNYAHIRKHFYEYILSKAP